MSSLKFSPINYHYVILCGLAQLAKRLYNYNYMRRRTKQALGAGLALTLTLATGVTAYENSNNKEGVRAAVSEAKLGATALAEVGEVDPNTARMAIANGLSCELGKVTKSYVTEPAGNLDLTIIDFTPGSETWNKAALAAREQYKNGSPRADDVIWDKGTGTQVYEKTPDGYVNKGLGMVVMNATLGAKYGPEVEAPTDAINKGGTILVFRFETVETGNKIDGTWQQTVAKIPCGAVREENGGWEPDTTLAVAPEVTTYTDASASMSDEASAFGGIVYPR